MSVQLVSAITALVAVIVSPIISLYVAARQIRASTEIAKRQIAASTVSASRQRWIDNLRDSIAEFLTAMNQVHFIPEGDLETYGDPRWEKVTLLLARIELLINPAEKDHAELIVLLRKLRSTSGWTIDSIDEELANQESQLCNAITILAQSILKREWERVKAGEFSSGSEAIAVRNNE